MKHNTIHRLIPAFIATVFAVGAFADHTRLDDTKTQFALPLDTAPTIDGTIDAEEWRRAGGGSGEWKVYVRPGADGNPAIRGGSIGDSGTIPADDADLSYNIYAGYDAQNLYIAVRVKDSSLNTDSAEAASENSSTWNDDSVEIFVDGDNSNFASRDTSGNNPDVVRSGGQFVITANNAYRDAEAGNPSYAETGAWFAKTTPLADGSGYDAEFRISLAALGNPKPGDILGFTVSVNDDDDGGNLERQVIWIGKPHTEVSYGNLILGRRSYTAPKASAAPTIDGIVHAEEYAGAQEIRIDGTSGNYELDGLSDGFTKSDHSYRAWAVHTADAVYVAVVVADDIVTTDSAEALSQDGSTWEDDSVEIFFDADRSLDLGRGSQNFEGQYVITANGAVRDNEANNPTFGDGADWYAVQSAVFGGYAVEFKVKKSALLAPADGTVLGFNVAINDDDGANRKAQVNWCGRPHQEFSYGTLTLAGAGGGGGGTIRIDRIRTEGDNIQVTFTSSNPNASVRVQETPVIAQPQWRDVVGVTLGTGAGGARSATFPKPAAAPRFYRVAMP